MAAKNLYEKDLYTILGVKKGDSDDVIKKQYRKLARELHPDKTKGDKKLEERFKAVSEAYEVLSDSKKSAEYNEMRDLYKSGGMRGGPQASGSGGGFGGGFDPFGGSDSQDIFSSFFGGGARQARRGGDLQTESTISFRDSIYGTELDLRLSQGTVTTRIPAGITDGAKIKLKGRGQPGQAGPGDLLILVNVIKHPVFEREEENLLMNLPVTFAEAALGADIKVPTLDGTDVTVRLAAGTPNGKVLRVKGKGVTRNHTTGDLFITVDVQVPQKLDNRAKQAIADFAAATIMEDPRKDLAQKARA